ncbi:hypothetical protein BHE74_00014949 [Ensete ventricosum]|nr:hypothetical protein BHE74_00014949 [Ensete ventricosum]
MFFYVAFMASGALGGLISITRLVPALVDSSRAAELPETLKGFGIDLGAVVLFAYLYTRESSAKNAQLAKLSREENLSKLKLRVDENRSIAVGDLRGVARLVILAGPASYIADSFARSKPYTDGLVERGVLVVPFATDGSTPRFELDEVEEDDEATVDRRKRLWRLSPLYTSEWAKWLDEQKKLANVSLDSPICGIIFSVFHPCIRNVGLDFCRYLSLRMDGRVRGSGVGYPPWNGLVAQLPPVKGLWSGLLDGMDGRVL